MEKGILVFFFFFVVRSLSFLRSAGHAFTNPRDGVIQSFLPDGPRFTIEVVLPNWIDFKFLVLDLSLFVEQSRALHVAEFVLFGMEDREGHLHPREFLIHFLGRKRNKWIMMD